MSTGQRILIVGFAVLGAATAACGFGSADIGYAAYGSGAMGTMLGLLFGWSWRGWEDRRRKAETAKRKRGF